MLRYYWNLARRLPAIFRGMVEGWGFWVAMALAMLGLLSPELASAAEAQMGSRWWGLIPVGLLVLWGLLRANYEQFQTQERKGRDLEQKVAEMEKAGSRSISTSATVPDLDVSVPIAVPFPSRGDDVMVLLPRVRITNRSPNHRVSLSLSVSIGIDHPLERLELSEYNSHQPTEDVPFIMQEFLHSPLDIAPQVTKTGSLSYLVHRGHVAHIGGINAFKRDLILKALDHVSGKVHCTPVPTAES